jgi:hypothetical protein
MRVSTENLYNVFAKYRLRPDIEACPCCVTPPDKKNLQKKKLEDLTTNDLRKYVFKAVTTWGTESDFKYFLPRILELLEEFDDINQIFIKLQGIHWEAWPSQEKEAIVAYLKFYLEYLTHEYSNIHDNLDSTLTYEMSLETNIEAITEFLNKEY